MTLHDALRDAYGWGVAHGTAVLIAAIVIPLVGAMGAQLAKGGRTDEDGRAIASVVVGVGVLAVLGELIAIHLAHVCFRTGLLDADVRLALAPIACLAGCLVAVRWVFPLHELAGARAAFQLAIVFFGCWALIWFFAQFRGWSLVFWGGFLQLIIVLAVAVFLLWRLFKRALGLGGNR